MNYTNSKLIKHNYNYYKRNLHNLPSTIYDAYDRPSLAKTQTFSYWQQYATRIGAKHLRILSHNCHFYTLGFVYKDNNEEYFAYITAQNQRCCKVKELENEC